MDDFQPTDYCKNLINQFSIFISKKNDETKEALNMAKEEAERRRAAEETLAFARKNEESDNGGRSKEDSSLILKPIE